MNIVDRINSLSSSLMKTISGRGTLPEQAEALQAAQAAAENPNVLVEARDRITTLETTLSTANAKIADFEQRMESLVQSRVGAVQAENTKLKAEAKTAQERAIEICARQGVPEAAMADLNKGAAKGETRAEPTNLTGIARTTAAFARLPIFQK